MSLSAAQKTQQIVLLSDADLSSPTQGDLDIQLNTQPVMMCNTSGAAIYTCSFLLIIIWTPRAI